MKSSFELQPRISVTQVEHFSFLSTAPKPSRSERRTRLWFSALAAKESSMVKPREPNGREPDLSEDDIQRELLGPRGVPGAPDPAKMTPQREKKTPKKIDPGHPS